MDRRDFLKLASTAGLGVAVGGQFSGQAKAADPYSGPLWLFIHASGGWDPTSFCDPKGTTNLDSPDRMNNYLQADIRDDAGNIKYAPVADNETFFPKWRDKLLVVNGIDTGTNSHEAGVRTTWCGTLSEGRPSLAALLAGVYAPTQAMAFISNGGYDYTGNVVSLTRVPDTGTLGRIAYPNRINPGDENTRLFHTDATMQRIATARDERHQVKLSQQHLPRLRQSMSTLYTSRLGQNELKQLIQYLPEDFYDNGIARQAQVAIAAYKAGICVSANLSTGGFDTHGQHDQNHFPSLSRIWTGVNQLMEFAEEQGVADKIYVVIGSDFGRTPGYNSGNGKDHWNITSMMMMGPNIQGNRVIGSTTDRHAAINVDPTTLAPVESGGVRLTPGHVHKALRKLGGIDTSEIVGEFALLDTKEDLPIFG
ncbi:DUF1501 domain-containing protein [Chondromyces apiculatus]|uniref:Tat (Twin-arginine translocation) pathway signal sequence domain protein n=1 Tax=Chondromyces apiculatus DSM 436 TaxID=1192034 RepID=A0A017T9K4_9BACT|nr:DUF1501 domain-containing protein [Chondromyces apiculatus]EYF05301.1 Hypothetical protein CAP_3442 [Chondromyces apiculatus DSM 436]